MSENPNDRRRIIELVIASSVVVISLASLFTAVYQSVVMRRTLEAAVWPRVPIWNRLNKARDVLDLAVCYCSVFDDCWWKPNSAVAYITVPSNTKTRNDSTARLDE